MDLNSALQFYTAHRKKLLALRYANFVIEWDMQTDCAEGSIAADSQQMGVIAERQYELTSDPQYVTAVGVLYENLSQLDDQVLRHEIAVAKKDIDDIQKIPQAEYAAFQQLTAEAYPVYVRAKRDNNFELFRPYLEKIVDYCRKMTVWLATDKAQGYDVLLDMYEPHYTQQQYDAFFNLLRQKLVPVIKKVTAKVAPIPKWATKKFDKVGQRQFCEYLRDVMCFDKSRGIMKESEHPFTTGFGTDDVRITNHYYENNFASSIFSAIHETGHALYEQQCDKSLNGTMCGGGASLGLHESQSRFYENIIGRNSAFWAVHYPALQRQFKKQLKDVTLEQFMAYVNRAERTFVRTEADELTYPLHVMLRYEVEKRLMDGSLQVKDLPVYWNSKFEEYFGITPPSDTLGVLQDVHWAYGNFGYFPTYALGSAIAAQLYHYMQKDFDVEQSLQSGNTAQVNAWLKGHVHKYGASLYPDEILRLATGEDFNPNYYVDYLLNKYCK